MVKCAKCVKLINKKNPGLQCTKCSKWLHGACASLSTDQLSTLFATESADWKCRACTGNAKPKRISFIMPNAEDDENTDGDNEQQPSTNPKEKIVLEIRREVRDVVRSELQNLQSILQFYSDKVDEYELKMKDYENQCTELKNTCKNLVLRNEVLEQKVNNIEQNLLCNYVEIYGAPEQEKEDVISMTNMLCTKINQNPKDIVKAYRKKASRAGPATNKKSPIVVLLSDGRRNQWLEAAKNTNISAKDLGQTEESKIILRESLTPNTAFLLWKAKTLLKDPDLCKYVWCKNGAVLVRKTDKEKARIIRSVLDIERAVADFQK